MILKGNQRGGGQQLAAHLQNSFDNERVEIADVRGSVAQDLSGAFAEWAAEARGTRCKKFLYSRFPSIPTSPTGEPPANNILNCWSGPSAVWKLVGQPRAAVFHEKRDKDGVLREHCHAVWSRIDTDRMKAVQISHDRLKLRAVAQEFARDHGLELPDGMKPGNSRDSRRDRYNKRAAQENLAQEKQQQERTGRLPKAERRAEIASCWTGTKNGAAFVHALETRGYLLARGDKRDYVVIDAYGEIHSLSRQLFMSGEEEGPDGPAGRSPGRRPARRRNRAGARAGKVFEGKTEAQQLKATRAKRPKSHRRSEAAAGIEKRIAALFIPVSSSAATNFWTSTASIFTPVSSASARRQGEMQADHHAEVAVLERQQKQPARASAAFLTRITGIGRFVAWAQDKADRKREAAHRHETDALEYGGTPRELKEMDRHYGALDRLEKRENPGRRQRRATPGIRQAAAARSFALKPEFEKGYHPPRGDRRRSRNGRERKQGVLPCSTGSPPASG